jgi:ABC-2 type transport system ATP-binding protein
VGDERAADGIVGLVRWDGELDVSGAKEGDGHGASLRIPVSPVVESRTVKPSITVHELSVVRGGVEALRRISVEVMPGRITGLLGPSGSGKTTLMRAIVGVQIVAGGEVTVLGLPAGTATLRSRVGYLTQAPSVYADLTVDENLRYFAAILGASRAQIDGALKVVGLESHTGQVVATLSGGERARVSLATALLNEPEVLILDEPTVGLDPVLRRDIWGTFRTLAGASRTILVSSHVMDEAERCDELILLREGSILATGSPAALKTSTSTSDLDAAFLALVDRTGADA